MKETTHDILDLIKTRRSVRRYKPQNVSEALLNKILEAARWAPSAVNRQPWRLIVIRNKEIRKEVGNSARYHFLVNRGVSEAPVIIAVCTEDKDHKWAPLGCAIASQNMMLEAHSLGLGSCFIGGFNEHKIKRILNLSSEMRVIALIPIGYPDGKAKTPPRLGIDEIVSYNVYSRKKGRGLLAAKSGVLSVIVKVLRRK